MDKRSTHVQTDKRSGRRRHYSVVYSNSCEPSDFSIGSEAVDCSPGVHESDMLGKMRDGVCEGDRLVLRGAIMLVNQAPSWVWIDAAVRCIGDYLDCTFYSGGLSNRFTVGFNRKSEVVVRCDRQSLRLIARNYSALAWQAIGCAVHAIQDSWSNSKKKRRDTQIIPRFKSNTMKNTD